MTNKPLSKAVCRETARLYNEAKGNITEAAKAAGLSRDTYKSRQVKAQQRFPKLFKDFPVHRGGQPKKEPRTVEQDVQLHAAKQEAGTLRAKYQDAMHQIATLQDQLKDLRWAAKMEFQPAEWTLPHHPKKKREHMPILLTSDFQAGEVIDAALTETGYGYNRDIFVRRYRRMIDTTIYLSFQHGGSGWHFPGMIYERGGDTLSNDIHEELAMTNDLTPLEACQLVFEEESAGILKLADAFGRVEVKTPGAGGNHDRQTPSGKGWTKAATKRNYDMMIALMLAREFKKDKRISFQTSDSFDVYFPVYDKRILLTHGDRMGSRGGQGFIGPAATILRGVQKVMMEQAALGRHVDCVDHGHFHYPMQLPFVNSNGCMPGYSEFAKHFRMRPEPPQQLLRYMHPVRGVVDYKPIILAEIK